MKIVCVVNQQETALVIDKSTRLSKFYKSKNTHCRCDISSCGHNLRFSTTIMNVFLHVTRQEFALCYAIRNGGSQAKYPQVNPVKSQGENPEDSRPGVTWLITIFIKVLVSWGESYASIGWIWGINNWWVLAPSHQLSSIYRKLLWPHKCGSPMVPPLARRNKHQPVHEVTAFCHLWGSDLLEGTKLGHVHPRMTNDFWEKDAVLCFRAEFAQTTG